MTKQPPTYQPVGLLNVHRIRPLDLSRTSHPTRSRLLEGHRTHRAALPICRPATCQVARPRFRDNLVQHAQREAASLAATTEFPELILPLLTEEKIQKALDYVRRQESIWDRTSRQTHESDQAGRSELQ